MTTTYESCTSTLANLVTAPTPIQWQELHGQPVAVKTEKQLVADAENIVLQIELGRTRIPREKTSDLRPGALIPLENAAAAPIDLYLGEQLIGRGEALELNGKFAVRILEIFQERI